MSADLSIAWAVMMWPLAACLLLPPLLVYLGLHVVKREVIFVDLALAQVATMGTCVALILGFHFNDLPTFWISLGVTFLAAGLFSWSRSIEKLHVPQEAIIGITFLALGAFYATFHRRFALISEDAAKAFAAGVRVRVWDFFFYAAFSLVVVNFVRIAGVLLTFAYLIVPAVCAVMLARSWATRLIIGWIIATIASVAGLAASYRFDLPTGAAIVVACGALLGLVGGFAAIRARGTGGA